MTRCCCCSGNNTGTAITPNIGENGNWWIGDEDTGVKAQGQDGTTPHVGENGNWLLGETDTGVKAQGADGLPGPAGPQGPVGPQGESGLMEEVYSTAATRIGTWIDGKPLYRRVFQYDGMIPAATDLTLNGTVVRDVVSTSQIGNFSKIIRLYGYADNQVGATITFPNTRLSAIYVPGTGIRMQSLMSSIASNVTVVVEYTV